MKKIIFDISPFEHKIKELYKRLQNDRQPPSASNNPIYKKDKEVLKRKIVKALLEDQNVKELWEVLKAEKLAELSISKINLSESEYIDCLITIVFIASLLGYEEKVRYLFTETKIKELKCDKLNSMIIYHIADENINDKALFSSLLSEIKPAKYIATISTLVKLHSMPDKMAISLIENILNNNRVLLEKSKEINYEFKKNLSLLLVNTAREGRQEITKWLIS